MDLRTIVDCDAPDQEPGQAECSEEIEDGGPAHCLAQPAAHGQGDHSSGGSSGERECRESENLNVIIMS